MAGIYQGPPVITDGPAKAASIGVVSGSGGLAFGWQVALSIVLVAMVWGAVKALMSWMPRIAIEPIQEDGQYRLRLTKNGNPRSKP